VMIAVRPDADQYLQPHVFTSSERVSEFFPLSLHNSVLDVATRMEAFCLSGIEGMSISTRSSMILTLMKGVVNNYRGKVLTLKSETSTLILRALRKSFSFFVFEYV
jgi:hypothetical protein